MPDLEDSIQQLRSATSRLEELTKERLAMQGGLRRVVYALGPGTDATIAGDDEQSSFLRDYKGKVSLKLLVPTLEQVWQLAHGIQAAERQIYDAKRAIKQAGVLPEETR